MACRFYNVTLLTQMCVRSLTVYFVFRFHGSVKCIYEDFLLTCYALLIVLIKVFEGFTIESRYNV